MAKISHLLALLVLLACTLACNRAPFMSLKTYSDVIIGTSQERLYAIAGQPEERQTLSSGTQKLLYIERVTMRPDEVWQRHYTIVVSDGFVVEKKMEEIHPLDN